MRALDVGDDGHADRAGRGPDPRRLDLRQHIRGRGSSTSTFPSASFAAAATWMIFRNRETPSCKAPIDSVGLGLADRVGRLVAGHARQGQGPRLVQLARRSSCSALVALIALRVFYRVGTDRASTRWSTCRSSSKRNFHGRHGRAVDRLRRCYFGNLVLLPLWLQTDIGYTATDAGLVMAPRRHCLPCCSSPIDGQGLATHRSAL